MSWLVLSYALAQQGPLLSGAQATPAWFGGRVVTTDDLHLGVRPAAYVDADGWGLGVTVQVTMAW